MVTTTNETCNGHCMDAAIIHQEDFSVNENGATFCSNKCRLERFEQRCHCGKKYTIEPEATDEQKKASASYLDKAMFCLRQTAYSLDEPIGNIMIIIRDVDVDTWIGLNIPIEDSGSTAIRRKVFKSDKREMGISFWCEPTK